MTKNRTIKKQFWFNRDEAAMLQKKAKKACITEAALVRLLVRGYEPREKPDDRFYDFARELYKVGDALTSIAQSLSRGEAFDSARYEAEVKNLHRFQERLEKEFIENRKVE